MVLPKIFRLKGYKCFNYLYKRGKRYYGKSMVLRVVLPKESLLNNSKMQKIESIVKFAISISNKVSKKAVYRNKLRRSFHDHLRVKLMGVKQKSWALLSLKPESSNKSLDFLLKECDELLLKAGLTRL